MKFEEAISHLIRNENKLIGIKNGNDSFALAYHWDKNLEGKVIYVSTNTYGGHWIPVQWQLESNDWEIL